MKRFFSRSLFAKRIEKEFFGVFIENYKILLFFCGKQAESFVIKTEKLKLMHRESLRRAINLVGSAYHHAKRE